jgi:pimeloyl-ACP methyl ester carboxylesterase
MTETEGIGVPTLMIQDGDDRYDEPAGSSNQDRWFTGGYRRIVLDDVGHFPHREAPDAVAQAIDRHLASEALD